MSEGEPSAATSPPAKPRRWRRRLLYALGAALALVVLLILLLPTIISTGPGTGLALSFANGAVPGTIRIEDLKLAWSKGQKITGLTLTHPDGETVLSIDEIDAGDVSLWAVLRGSKSVGTINIIKPHARYNDLKSMFAGDERTEQRSDKKSRDRSSGEPLSPSAIAELSVKLNVVDGQVILGPNDETITITLPTAEVDVLDPSSINTSLEATVAQGDDRGEIALQCRIDGLFDSAGRMTLAAATIDAQANVTNVPSALLDRITEKGQLYQTLLGPTLQADVHARGAMSSVDAAVNVHSEHLTVEGQVTGDEQRLTLAPGGRVHLDITPTAWSVLAELVPQIADTQLVQPFAIEAVVNELTMPVLDRKIDLAAGVIDVHLKPSAIIVDAGRKVGRITLTEASATLSGAPLGDRIDATIAAVAAQGDHTGKISLSATAQNALGTDGALQESFNASIDGTIADVPLAIVDQFVPQLDGLAQQSIGPTVTVTLHAQGARQGEQFAATYDGTVTSERVNMKWAGQVDGPQLTASIIEADATVTPELFSQLMSRYGDNVPSDYRDLAIAEPLNVHVTLSDIAVPLKDFDAAALAGGLAIHVKQISPLGVAMLDGVSVRDLSVKSPVAGLSQTVNFQVDADVLHNRDVGKISVSGKVADMLSPSRTVELKLTADNVSVPLIEQIANQPGKLSSALSGNIDHVVVSIENDANDPARWRFDVGAESGDDLQARIVGNFEQNRRLSLSDQTFVQYMVTPDRYAALTAPPADAATADAPKSAPLRLVAPVNLKLAVKQAQVNWRPAADDAAAPSPDVLGAGFDLQLSAPSAVFDYELDGVTRRMALSDVVMTSSSQQLRQAVTLGLDGSVQTKHPQSGEAQTSPLKSTTTVTGLFDSSGKVNVQQMRLETDTRLAQVPVALVDSILAMNGKLTAAIGPTARIEAVGRYPGDLNLLAKSDTVEIPLPLRIDQQRNISLSKDIDARFMLTEDSARVLLGDVHPVFRDAVASKEPVRLIVKHDPFHIPLKNFAQNKDKLAIDATLTMGTIMMRRKGWLTEGLNDLTAVAVKVARQVRRGLSDEQEEEAQVFEAVFTPMHVRVAKGKLTTSETWVTSADMAVGFQGGVDLVAQKYKFIMGVLGASLVSQAPLLIEIVDPTNVFDVPVMGKIGKNPKVDTKDFSLALAGSTVKQQLRRVGPVAQEVFDIFAKEVQKGERQRHNLTWNKPLAAVEFEQAILRDKPKKEHDPRQARKPDDKRQSAKAQKKEPADLGDLLFQEIGRVIDKELNKDNKKKRKNKK